MTSATVNGTRHPRPQQKNFVPEWRENPSILPVFDGRVTILHRTVKKLGTTAADRGLTGGRGKGAMRRSDMSFSSISHQRNRNL
ncbi:hypothetical protein GVN24_04070 [Rhizobium sp. CRIBSB]|uniref:Ribosomal protein L2 n=1 Tax=Peteryoungia aggregata LMG 23059 TaxID=1368425 RepID=A0ABU0G6H4_9HYPH|nr:hypothetical protein [Peteryoungia aggregata]MDQ0420946.1 hypothetical protein [Peteryoungia aggregata LMG 23059]NBB47442.1 hypothetical protein [Rhizobium sp. CRIBSB]